MNIKQSDQLLRFSFDSLPVRGAIVHLNEAWQSILQRNSLPADACQVLGQAVAAAALMTSQIRFSGTLGVQLQSSGQLRLALAQCTDDGKLRALCRMDDSTGETLISGGVLSINMEGHSHQQRYQGIVSVDDGNLPNALQRYFAQSEQLPTAIHLAVSETSATGLMLQQIPPSDEELQGEPDDDAWNRLLILVETLTDEELLELPAEDVLRRLFHQEQVRVQTSAPLTFACSCTRTRVAEMLRGVGRAEVEAVLAERGSVEVVCEYCNQPYGFDPVDIEELFSSDLPPSQTSPHQQ